MNTDVYSITAYCNADPALELQDVFKYLYQSCFGCEHLFSESPEPEKKPTGFSRTSDQLTPIMLDRILAELPDAELDDLPEVEMLDGDYCRVHLKALQRDSHSSAQTGIIDEASQTGGTGGDSPLTAITPETLCALFIKSARREPDGESRLMTKLAELTAASRNGLIRFTEEEVRAAIESWRQNGFCPVHHSENYRKLHHPAYRIIAKQYLR